MVEQARINAIKDGVDLATFIQTCGIELKKSGKSYKGHCPFHEDKKSPSLSVTPSKKLWQCFGCGKGGDVIDFARQLNGSDFDSTIAKLEGHLAVTPSKKIKSPKKPVKKKKEETPALTPAHYKLLQRVVDFYHTAFNEDFRAREYLQDRGITDKSIFADYKVGFANGTLLNVLPDDGETVSQLKELGIINSKGREHFYGCATFPLFDENNNPVGMYGRTLYDLEQENMPRHWYLPGERKGVFNRQGAKSGSEVHLTESILDGLALINGGFRNTIPCYGTNGLTVDILRLLKQEQPERVYVCFDGDEAGYAGAEKVRERLEKEGLTAHAVRLPEMYDLNIFFNPKVKKEFDDPKAAYTELYMKAAGLEPPPRPEPARQEGYKAFENGFSLTIAGRCYEVRGINRKQNKLKATVKGIKTEKKTSKKRFHVDTVDFYSARSRAFLARGLADLFGVDEKAINEDLEQLLDKTEGYKPSETKEIEEAQKITAKDKASAMAFLKSPNLLEEIIADLETIGFTGEEMNKLLCYLAAVSRKMSDPLSVMIQSRSAAGKSCLQDTILSLIPEEDFIKYTRLTDQALFYKEADSLAHKILAIEELDGMNGAIYSIRTIQSSKKITVAYTGKDPVTGEMKTGENTVEGPLMVFITTTQVDIDGETASRFVFLSIDESQEMTEKILAKQRQSHTMAGLMNKLAAKKIISKHLAAQRLLKPILVINPYADLLSFDSKSLRARRDHMKYLNLILTITFLFQYQRPQQVMDYDGDKEKYILVTMGDIARANEIAAEVLGRSLDELSPSSRKLLILIKNMCMSEDRKQRTETREVTFTRRDIREFSGWSDFQVKTHIKQLEELEYIYSLTGRKGKEYLYELVYKGGGEDDKPFLIGLADLDEVRRKAEEQGLTAHEQGAII